MKYILRKVVLGDAPEFEISEKEYSEIVIAKNTLENTLSIEEKYEIVISNYLDFEHLIMNITINNMIREMRDYSDFFGFRLDLNLKLVNLLTAVRLYVDQINQNVTECLPANQNVKEAVKALFSKEYDENKYYRFMETLRNYVQHRGIPVHWTQHSARWTSHDEHGQLEYSLKLASLRSTLEEDGKIKKSVLDEFDEKIDLVFATRSYIESISNVHASVRGMINNSTDSCRGLFELMIQRYSEICSDSLLGLSACIWKDEAYASCIPILLKWDDVRIQLQKRNGRLINLSKRYASSAIDPNKYAIGSMTPKIRSEDEKES